jgi:hypothetical protein
MATPEQIAKIKANVATIASKGGSREYALNYLKMEGVTIDELRQSPVQPKSMTREVAEQAGAGLLSGIAQGTVGLPGTLAMGAEFAGRKTGKGINLLLERLGVSEPGTAEKTEQEYLAGMEQMYPGFAAGTRTVLGLPTGYAVQQAVDPLLENVGLPYPQTDTGRRVRLGSEIVGSAAIPVAGAVGLAAKTGRPMLTSGLKSTAAYGVTPAVTSELGGIAGQTFFPGTAKAEEYGRMAGALAGGGIGYYGSRGSRAQQMVSAPLKTATADDLNKAQNLIREGRLNGINLTPSEALYQVTGGKVDLTDVQRIIERVEPGAEKLRPFMTQRTEAVSQAIEDLKSRVSPTAGVPSEIGPKASAAAKKSITDVRKSINRETDPLYISGEQGVITQTGFNNLIKNDLFSSVLSQVRKDPAFSQGVKGVPSTSVKVLDAMRKKAEDLAKEASRAGKNNLSAKYGDVKRVIDDEITATISAAEANASRTNTPLPSYAQSLKDYQQAIARQAELRGEVLSPVQRGTLGDIERAGAAKSGEEATSLAGKAISPKTIAEGKEQGIKLALDSLKSQNPKVAQQLVRSVIDQRQQKYVADLLSGPNQYGGAAFAQSLAGSPQKMKNFATAIEAVTNGRTAEEASRLMNVLKATGARKRPGSDTAFNTEIIDALKRPEGAKTIANIFQPLSAGARVRTAVEDMQFKANASKLADILTSEKGLELLASYGAEGRNIAGRALSNFILSQSASTTTTIKKPLVVDVYPQPGLLGQ